jgi:hypothetical protein
MIKGGFVHHRAGRAEGAAVPANGGRHQMRIKGTYMPYWVPPPSGTSLLPTPSAANANANTGTSETSTLPTATPRSQKSGDE